DFLKDGIIQEEVAGDFLFIQGKTFFGQVGIMDEIASSFLHLPYFKEICSANLFVEAEVDYIFGMPYTMKVRGLSIDADRNICAVIGSSDKIKEFMTISGYTSSTLEHNIWEKWYGEGAISAIKAIQIANENGISVYDIDSSNVGIVDGFNIPNLAKQDIKNSINAGMIAKCSSSNINYLGWQGIGYIIQDPITGEGKYEIADVSGGTIILLTLSLKKFDDYYTAEEKAIDYAKTLTPGDNCSAFANFAQYLADRWVEAEPNEDIRRLWFTNVLFDLSVSDEFYKDLYIFGCLGYAGPRHLRPKWLNTHDDASGFRLIVPCDCGAEDGRKDHFVTNAVIFPFPAELFAIYVWELRGEDCKNDRMYNLLGASFGEHVRLGIVDLTNGSDVRNWIMNNLHEKK
ncbi:MAG: hypothetical protein AB1630_07615, partial [bacterium]